MSNGRTRTVALGATLALHALALGALLAYQPAREALLGAVIMVDFISPPKLETAPEPPTGLPKPTPAAIRFPHLPDPAPIVTAPIVAAPAELPSPVAAPPPAAIHEPATEPSAAPAEPALPLMLPVFDANYLENRPPPYPALSRRLGEQGRVILRVLVNPAGRADEVQVRESSGYPRLDEAARQTVRGWKFVPARRGSQSASSWVLVPISFRLED